MTKDNKFRSRVMALLLYPDDITHVNALNIIRSSYDYIGVLHDKDFNDNGELKKPHWHIILRFKNACWNTAIAKDLCIEVNYTEQIRNLDNSILYLIHFNDSDKFQYSKDEVFGTFKSKLFELVNSCNKSECEKVLELIEYLHLQSNYISVTDFSRYCAYNGYWSEFRRSATLFVKMIDEKNDEISSLLQKPLCPDAEKSRRR